MQAATSKSVVQLAAVTIGLLIVCSGCDPISSTRIHIHCDTLDDQQPSGEIVKIIAGSIEENGLQRIEQDAKSMQFSNLHGGARPSLWAEINFGKWPIEIEISEMYISRRTDKHEKLADNIKTRIKDIGYDIVEESHSDTSNIWWWFLLLLLALVLSAMWCGLMIRTKMSGSNPMHGNPDLRF